jgi:hypothetical protein
MVKENSNNIIKRSDSHHNFAYHDNIHLTRNPESFYQVSNQQNVNFIPGNRTLYSPVIQRVNTAHIIIPPRGPFVHDVQKASTILSRQIIIPS